MLLGGLIDKSFIKVMLPIAKVIFYDFLPTLQKAKGFNCSFLKLKYAFIYTILSHWIRPGLIMYLQTVFHLLFYVCTYKKKTKYVI